MLMKIFQGIGQRISTASELLQFFGQTKWWWLTPMLAVLLVLGVAIVFAQTSAIAPFIYTLF
jgi:hypothetical protein